MHTLMDVPGRWPRLCTRLDIPDAAGVFNNIAVAYSEEHRAYHNLRHIDSCLAGVFSYMKDVDQAVTDVVELALWFHDFVYDPQRSDNEEQSVGAMKALLKSYGINPKVLSDAAELILLTKTHEPRSASAHLRENRAAYFMLDIDLSILGEPPGLYWKYEHAIRQEYSFVPQAIYNVERVKVLRKLQEREDAGRLFMTELVRGIYNNQARQNIAHAIAYLEAMPLK